MDRSKTLKGYAGLFICAALWGAMFVPLDLAIEELGEYRSMAIRAAAAALFFFFLFIFNKNRNNWFQKNHIVSGMLGGLLFTAEMLFLILALGVGDVARVGLLITTTAIMIPFIDGIIYKRWPGNIFFVPAIGIFLGYAIKSNFELQEIITLSESDGYVLVSAFFFASHIAFLGNLPSTLNLRIFNGWQMLFHALFSILLFWAVPLENFAIPQTLLPYFYAFISGFIGMSLLLWLQAICQQFVTPTGAAVILITDGLFAALAGYIFLGIMLNDYEFVGYGIVFCSALLATVLDVRRQKQT